MSYLRTTTGFLPAFLFVTVLAFALSASSSDALEIKVNAKAVVLEDTVLLGHIANFRPDTDHRVARLRGIEVAVAPSPGKTFTLSAQFLKYKIGSIASAEEDIRLLIPENVLVERKARVLSKQDLEEIYRDHVEDHAPPSAELHFESIRVPESVALPVGDLHWETRSTRPDRYVGRVPVLIAFWVDGKLVRKVPVSGRISVSQEMVMAARRIPEGSIIADEDLVLVQEQRTKISSHALTSFDDALGKRAIRTIRAGKQLTTQMIENLPLVEKGKRVVIMTQYKGVRATTLGKVLEDGQAGDQVRVINVTSGKEIFSTVKGPGVVEVVF
jgi:flagella basal body P-ring formation protein FlgA